MDEFYRFGFAFLSGVILSISGSCAQVSLKNEMASPSTLGIDAIVVFIVILASLILSVFGVSNFYLEISALILCFILCALFFFTSFKRELPIRQLKPSLLVLIGLGINLLIGAVFALIQFFVVALNFTFPSQIWFGSFSSLSTLETLLFVLGLLSFFFLVFKFKKSFVLHSLDHDLAQQQGFRHNDFIRHSITICFLGTALVVTLFGVFSFLSLIFPLIIRLLPFKRGDFAFEISGGAILSGFLLALIDLACYHFTFYGVELPAGVFASVIGSCGLILLLIKRYQISFRTSYQ